MSRSMKILLLVASFTGLALAACTGGPVKVGAVLPLEGTYAIYGEPIQRGIELAYEEIQQEEGGINIVLEIRDSGSDPERAAELLEELFRGGAVAAIGGVTTDSALKMVPVAEREDKILLSPSASSPGLTGISREFFRIYPSDFREGSKMGNFAAETLGIDKMVILAAESAFARGIQDIFQSEYERYGGEVIEVIEYPSTGTDFSGLVERALSLEPVGVYVADYAQNVSQIIAELRDQDFDGKILTTSAYAAPGVIEEAGENAEGVLLTQIAVVENDPNLIAFEEAYRAKYNEDPSTWAAHGYDALKVLVAAMEEGGTRPSDVWKGMRGIKGYKGATGIIQFNEKGDVGKFPRTYVVDGGELVDYEEAVEAKRQEILSRIGQLNRSRRQSGGDES